MQQLRAPFFIFFVMIVASWEAIGASLDLAPDLILHNGKIVTVDSAFNIVQAIAIKDGRFVAVGTNAEVLKLAGARTQKLDLQGKTVIPGLYDSHNHMLNTGIAARRADLSQATSVHDVLTLIGERAKKSKPGEWIVASSGWHEGLLKEKRFPTKEELDRVAPGNPVYIPRGGHNVVVNSLAFKLAGITKETPNPPGEGVYVKDPKSGELTGHIIGVSAFGRIARLIPPFPQEEMVEILREVTSRYNALGITSVIEPGLAPDQMRAYQAAWQQGKLTVRTNMMLRLELRVISPKEALTVLDHWGVFTGFGNDMLKVSGIKMSLDGGVETGFMRDVYAYYDDPQHPRGIQNFSTEALAQTTLAAAERGWQVGVHCVGDACIDSLLTAMQEVNKKVSLKGRRFTVVHGMMLRPEQLEKAKALDLVVTAQQPLNFRLTGAMLKYWGKERTARSLPFRMLVDSGIPVGAGSDSPTGPSSPFLAMWSMVTRETAQWGVQGADQRTTIQEALKLYTMGSAYMAFEEKIKGSIETGKLADLVILNDDILTVPTPRIREINVLKTMLGGRFAYEAP